MTGRSGSSIRDSKFSNNRNGIHVGGNSGISIVNTEVIDNYIGISVNGSSSIVVRNSLVQTNEQFGLFLNGGSTAEFIGSTQIVDNKPAQAILAYASHVYIGTGVHVENNGGGIGLSVGSSALIGGASIADNDDIGVSVGDNSMVAFEEEGGQSAFIGRNHGPAGLYLSGSATANFASTDSPVDISDNRGAGRDIVKCCGSASGVIKRLPPDPLRDFVPVVPHR